MFYLKNTLFFPLTTSLGRLFQNFFALIDLIYKFRSRCILSQLVSFGSCVNIMLAPTLLLFCLVKHVSIFYPMMKPSNSLFILVTILSACSHFNLLP